jgi:hypothetical protein
MPEHDPTYQFTICTNQSGCINGGFMSITHGHAETLEGNNIRPFALNISGCMHDGDGVRSNLNVSRTGYGGFVLNIMEEAGNNNKGFVLNIMEEAGNNNKGFRISMTLPVGLDFTDNEIQYNNIKFKFADGKQILCKCRVSVDENSNSIRYDSEDHHHCFWLEVRCHWE